MDTNISENTFSTLIVAEYPARACVPNGFTTACTITVSYTHLDVYKRQTMSKELLDFFDFNKNTPSVSAVTQQRSKVLPEACEYLFKSFTDDNLSVSYTHLDVYKRQHEDNL